MNTRTTNDKKVIEEALLILKEHLEPLKFLQFVAACNLGEGDYLDFKDKLFEHETHESLYQKILDFRKEKENLVQEDYINVKDKLLEGETVDSLHEKIKAYQDSVQNEDDV